MGEPLKLNGHIVASYFASIELEAGVSKSIIDTLNESPPVTEKQWIEFFRKLLTLRKHLDCIQLSAQAGLQVAKDNRTVSTTRAKEAAMELSRVLDEIDGSIGG